MGLTMAQKVLADHAAVDHVVPGQLIVTEVDNIILSDVSFRGSFDALPADILRAAHPNRVAVLLDHGIPAPTIAAATAHKRAREHSERLGFRLLADVGHGGIEHQIILDAGLALPGRLIACSDSHTSGAGVVNCAGRGLGMADMVELVCTGRTWYRVSPAVNFRLQGELQRWVYGKDVFLYLAGRYGSQEGCDIEIDGPGLSSMSFDDRSTLASMCTELNANFVMMPADDAVRNFLAHVASESFTPVESDHDADYEAVYEIDISSLVPCVALPDAVNKNVRSVDEVSAARVRIDQAFIGSCANGKLADLRVAAEILKGRKIADGVRLIVTPASQAIYLEAIRLGYIESLASAGALVTNSTCGACSGGHMGVLAAGETCITSSTRNYKGRMGSADARIYMASSATVAASSLTGWISDPREFPS